MLGVERRSIEREGIAALATLSPAAVVCQPAPRLKMGLIPHCQSKPCN